MKRLIVVAALVSAACGLQEPMPGSALPENHVVLATFTGTVDTEAGTFDIRVDPDPTASPQRASLVITEPSEVTVASATPFFGGTPVFCGGVSRAVWGATVTVTNQMASTRLGGTYAEITEFVGGTGLEACNGAATPPAGISGQYGAWSFGVIAPGASSAGNLWRFKYSTASQFTFRGRIVAAKVDTFASESTIGTSTPPPVDAGSYMVFADNTAATLWFVDAAGARVASTAIAARATALAVDRTNGLVWYTTVDSGGSSWIGHVNLTGGGKVEFDAGAAWGSALGFTLIAADPSGSPGKAFAYSSLAEEVFFFDSSLLGIVTTNAVSNPPLASIAVGPLEAGGTRWIYGTTTAVAGTSGTIEKWSTAGSTIVGARDVGGTCAGPRGILLGPDGKMWFQTTNRVCTATTPGLAFSTFAVQRSSVPGTTILCTAPDGTVWSPSGSSLYRVGDSTHDNYNVSVTGMTMTGCSSGAGYLWGLSSGGTGTIVRIQP